MSRDVSVILKCCNITQASVTRFGVGKVQISNIYPRFWDVFTMDCEHVKNIYGYFKTATTETKRYLNNLWLFIDNEYLHEQIIGTQLLFSNMPSKCFLHFELCVDIDIYSFVPIGYYISLIT